MQQYREENSVPLELERDRIHNVDVQGDQQTSRTLVPGGMKCQPQTIGRCSVCQLGRRDG